MLHWDQRSCHLICAGDSKVIQIWDIETETKLTALSTGVNSSVTSLSMQSKGKSYYKDIFYFIKVLCIIHS